MAGIKQCLILAAGNGRRIRGVSGNNPKPLVQVHDIPLLEHVLVSAQHAGIESFVVGVELCFKNSQTMKLRKQVACAIGYWT